VSSEPIDIIMLSHERLGHLVATVEALHARTPEPFRLTLVDNASGPDVRNWIVANRQLFERVIFRPTNEHQPAFQLGIDATTSDPYIVTDPDVVVPDLEPSWLARMLGLLERNSEFGLIGMTLDDRPEAPVPVGELVEENVGTWFQVIRRDALRVPYTKDSTACRAVRDAGFRVGHTVDIVGHHLGGHDYERYPAYVHSKIEAVDEALAVGRLPPYVYYERLETIPRPPKLGELAEAAPIWRALSDAGAVPEATLEVTWRKPLLEAVLDGPVAVRGGSGRIPLEDRAAAAVVLVEPSRDDLAEALAEAFRIATTSVVVLTDLETVEGRSAEELAAHGWSGVEAFAPSDLLVELAALGDENVLTRPSARYVTSENRLEWLEFWARGAFGDSTRRLFVFRAVDGRESPRQLRGVENLDVLEPEPSSDQPRRDRAVLRPFRALRFRAGVARRRLLARVRRT
jgi:hypothetical protein